MAQENEISLEKSTEQARIIMLINTHLSFLDLDYLQKFVESVKNNASFKESAIILNPSYNLDKIQLERTQACAAQLLIDYAKKLHEVEEIKKKIQLTEQQQSEINKLFNM